MEGQEQFEEETWDTKVAIKEDKRHGQAFNPSLPSNHTTAVVLSFFGLKNEVCRMLQTLSHQARAYIVNQNGLPGFLVAWQLEELVRFPVTDREKAVNFEWPTLAQMKEFPLTKQIKLCNVHLYGGANLMQIKLHFTNGIESPMMQSSEYVEGYYEYSTGQIDITKNIKGVSMQINSKVECYFDGMKFEDKQQKQIAIGFYDRGSVEWTKTK